MPIKSFKIDHKKLKPGIYINDVQKFGNTLITTYDLRFKIPNKGTYLSNSAMHSLEHLIAHFYSKYYPKDKIYFGPMGCQTGFYLVVYGKKSLDWLNQSLVKLNKFIINSKQIPGSDAKSCGNFKNLNLITAKKEWNKWYSIRSNWQKVYKWQY